MLVDVLAICNQYSWWFWKVRIRHVLTWKSWSDCEFLDFIGHRIRLILRVTNAFITRVFIDNRIQTTISSIKSAFVIIRYVIAKTISNTIPILTIWKKKTFSFQFSGWFLARKFKWLTVSDVFCSDFFSCFRTSRDFHSRWKDNFRDLKFLRFCCVVNRYNCY